MANKKANKKAKNGSSNVLMNVIIVVLIVAVLALAVWAVYPKFKKSTPADVQPEQQQQTMTIKSVSDQLGISPDELRAKYSIDGADDADISTVTDNMTIENYVMLMNDVSGQQSTVDEFIAQNGIPQDSLTPQTTVREAIDKVPVKFYMDQVKFDTDFDTMKKEAGLGDDVTPDTPWSQISEQMTTVLQNHMVQEEQPVTTEGSENSQATVNVENSGAEK